MKKLVYYYKVVKTMSFLNDTPKGRPFKYQSYEEMTVGHTYYCTAKGNIKVLALLEVWDPDDCSAPLYEF